MGYPISYTELNKEQMLFHLSDFMSQMIDDQCPRDNWAWGLCILIIYHYIKQTSFMWSVQGSPSIPKKQLQILYCTEVNSKKQLQILYHTEVNSINCRDTKDTIYHGFRHMSGILGYGFDSNVWRMLTCRSEHLITHSVTEGRSGLLCKGCLQESTEVSGPCLLTFITDPAY